MIRFVRRQTPNPNRIRQSNAILWWCVCFEIIFRQEWKIISAERIFWSELKGSRLWYACESVLYIEHSKSIYIYLPCMKWDCASICVQYLAPYTYMKCESSTLNVGCVGVIIIMLWQGKILFIVLYWLLCFRTINAYLYIYTTKSQIVKRFGFLYLGSLFDFD